MKSLIFLYLVLLKSFEAVEPEMYARLNMLDNHMKRLNLTDIHFKDPGNIVNVDTVINVFRPESTDNLIQRLQKKVNETADLMTKTDPQVYNPAVIIPPQVVQP